MRNGYEGGELRRYGLDYKLGQDGDLDEVVERGWWSSPRWTIGLSDRCVSIIDHVFGMVL